jgi:hypothetical protein
MITTEELAEKRLRILEMAANADGVIENRVSVDRYDDQLIRELVLNGFIRREEAHNRYRLYTTDVGRELIAD